MKLSLLLLAFTFLPLLGQDDDSTATGGQPPRALPVEPQSGPAAAQSAEASREKLLKAADQIEMIQSNAELTKVTLDGMKNDIAQLQTANSDLKQQVAALRSALDKAEADHARERQALLDEVSQLLASRGNSAPAPKPRKHVTADSTEPSAHHQPAEEPQAQLTPPPDPAPVQRQKGYSHTVEKGETLTMICTAYRDQGVNVSVAQVRKANGLTPGKPLKVGQKLFIPKPGA